MFFDDDWPPMVNQPIWVRYFGEIMAVFLAACLIIAFVGAILSN
jgi:hypothetical protein